MLLKRGPRDYWCILLIRNNDKQNLALTIYLLKYYEQQPWWKFNNKLADI
jgi:hypothetical protein